MPGPTAWQQTISTSSFSTQTITTTAETVIATLANVFSRSPGQPITVLGFAQFAVQAAATSTTLRIRTGSLTGAVLNTTTAVFAGTAASVSQDQLSIVGSDTPAGEYFNQVYVLTIQAAAAGANWNVVAASLTATL